MPNIRVGGGGSILVVLEGFVAVKDPKGLPNYAGSGMVFRAKKKGAKLVTDMGGTCIFKEQPGNSAQKERHLHFTVT